MTHVAPAGTDDRIYRLLVEAVVDYAIYLLSPDGRVATWNAGARRIKGYADEEIIGQSFSKFFTEEDRLLGRPEAALEAARRDGRFENEGWRVRKDGTRFWALAVIDVVRDEAGHIIGYAKITRDLTERYTAQQALLESERRFRLLVEGVTDYAIFMLDPEGRVANWNAGARRIKGYEAGEIVGQHFSRFYSKEDRAAGVPQRALAEAEATDRFEAEGWRIRKDGTRFWASVIIDAIRDSGKLVGFAKVTRDITERREAQRALDETRDQLAQSQKLEALGQLTGGVAHDFNNLLQVISSGITLAEKLPTGSTRLSQILREMQNAAARGATLTKQLLAFARRSPLRLEVVDTAKEIEEAVALFGRMLGTDISLDVQVEQDVSAVRIDTAQFEIALLNLAVNARDAMPNGGVLRIKVHNLVLDGNPQGFGGPFVAISVRDNGVGIPEEVLGRIFEPFFTTKPVGKGTGLGLSQVHGFAQQVGGTVTIVSKVEEGTEVTLLLPAVSRAEAARHQPDGNRGENQLTLLPKGLRILVVDDDAAVGRLTARMLEGAGHRPMMTTDPEVALQLVTKGGQFDLVISDVIMPNSMSGVDLAREIRRHRDGLPLLLVSGYAGDSYPAAGEFPVLPKPFTALELSLAIRALLHRKTSVP
jgi:PAS domain S-box-containing protein